MAVCITVNSSLTIVLAVFIILPHCNAASAHIHTHQHNKIDSNERMQDGAFSPRDSEHYTDEGEHHHEFDHEAILGMTEYNNMFLQNWYTTS